MIDEVLIVAILASSGIVGAAYILLSDPQKVKRKRHEPQRTTIDYGELLGRLLAGKRELDRHGMWVSKCPACGTKLWATNYLDYKSTIGPQHAIKCRALPEFIDRTYPKGRGV